MSKHPTSDGAEPNARQVEGFAAGHDCVLLCGFSAAIGHQLAAQLDSTMRLRQVASPDEALAVLRQDEVAVLCVGEPWVGKAAEQFLQAAHALGNTHRRLDMVLSAGDEPEIFQDLIDQDLLYYMSPKAPPLDDIGRILNSASNHRRSLLRAAKDGDKHDDSRRQILGVTQALNQATLEELPVLACQILEQLLDVEQAECLLYDRPSETLWTRTAGLGDERRESAAAGLVSFVVRTASPVCLDRVGADPRYESDADNDGGDPDQRFLAVPIVSNAAEARALGVLVALRAPSGVPFDNDDQAVLRMLAEQLAPAVDRCMQQVQLDQDEQQQATTPNGDDDLFRREALEHYFQDLGDQGHLLELSPRWTQWTYPLLLSVVLVALIYSAVASVHEYADGDAIVRVEGRDDITAPLAGTVSSIEVEPNQTVAAGDLLVRLYGAQEAAELERLEREFELGLLNRLRNPADPNIERALGALQARKRLAEARLEERSVRAPRSGVVSDVRVRRGQLLSPGEVILSLHGDDQELSIVAVFPGHYRPLIQLGMPIRLELQGYRFAYQQLKVDALTDEVFGPLEARRLLGPGGDSIPLDGPVVLVYARLPSATFESDDRTYDYHDGISGRAEIRVRSERLLATLIPALENFLPAPTS